jgi:CBS domain-containing protein
MIIAKNSKKTTVFLNCFYLPKSFLFTFVLVLWYQGIIRGNEYALKHPPTPPECNMKQSESIFHFLEAYPPFDRIVATDLAELCQLAQIRQYQEGDLIFKQGQMPQPFFCVVKSGLVQLVNQTGDDRALDNECDEGDIFGIRASLANDNYLADAIAAEPTELILLPLAKFHEITARNPKVALFLATIFAASITAIRAEAPEEIKKIRTFLEKRSSFSDTGLEFDAVKIDPIKHIVDCTPQHTIREAAKIMSIFRVGSILVTDAQKKPLGIITDSDFRKKVVSVETDIKQQPVTEIMSSPVKTIKPNLSISEMVLLMLSQRVGHFCITEDGTDQSPAIGVVSQRDILIAQGNNPIVLTKQIMQSVNAQQLHAIREQAEVLVNAYLQRDFAVPFVANIITEINNVLTQRAAEIATQNLIKKGLTIPEIKFCWVVIGAEGRREQLLRTDLDTILIYENIAEDQEEVVKEYFLLLAQEINQILIECGFEESELGITADKTQWCQSLKAWQSHFGAWIDAPHSIKNPDFGMFLDFRPVAGNFNLANQLKDFIFDSIQQNGAFLRFLAKLALRNLPPMSFFGSFIVEQSGDHRNKFDIKARALRPLSDAARVLAFSHQLRNYGSTFDRFEEVASLQPPIAEVCSAGAVAYEILLKQRALYGLKHKSSGRYIIPDELSKGDKQTLRSIFKVIEKVQKTIETRFDL